MTVKKIIDLETGKLAENEFWPLIVTVHRLGLDQYLPPRYAIAANEYDESLSFLDRGYTDFERGILREPTASKVISDMVDDVLRAKVIFGFI